MMHYETHRREFAGRVLDGPYEGDWVEQDEPYFEAYHQRPLSGVMAYSSDPLPSAGFEIDRVLYKWLRGYRAWAWVQPMARAARSVA